MLKQPYLRAFLLLSLVFLLQGVIFAQEQPLKLVLTTPPSAPDSAARSAWPDLAPDTSSGGMRAVNPTSVISHTDFGGTLNGDDVTPANGIACIDEPSLRNAENSYYQIFDLNGMTDKGGNPTAGKDFVVTRVRFGVQSFSDADPNKSVSVLVKMHTLDRRFLIDNKYFSRDSLVLLSSKRLTIPSATAPSVLDVAIFASVPADTLLVGEVVTESNLNKEPDTYIYIGTSNLPGILPSPNALSYIRAPGCGITGIEVITELPGVAGIREISLVMAIDGFIVADNVSSALRNYYTNPSFEIDGDANNRPDSWKLVYPSSPRVDSMMCGKALRAYDGSCSWLIKGSPVVRTLKRNVKFNPAVSSNAVIASLMVSSNSVKTNIQATMRITYEGGTTQLVNLTLKKTPGANIYRAITLSHEASGNVAAVLLTVKFSALAPSLNNVDYASLRIVP